MQEKKKNKPQDKDLNKDKKKGDLDDFIFCHEFIKEKSER